MATAGDEKPAGVNPVPEQEEKEALFAKKHAELVSKARDVAREHGVAVTTVAFRPDGTAVANEVVGGGFGRQEQVQAMIQRAIERKVALMESGELAAHRRELQLLRGMVVGELTQHRVAPRGKKRKETDDGEVGVAKRPPAEQQETTDGEVGVDETAPGQQQKEKDGDAGAGCNKISSVD